MTDQQLQNALQSFIDNAVAPSTGEIAVAVDHGVVTLTGRVATNTQRMAIRDLIGATRGVQHVLYAIEVGSITQVHA